MSNTPESAPASSKAPLATPPKPISSECVKVVVRCRPMTEKEVSEGHERVVEMSPDRGVVSLKNFKNTTEPLKTFTFDAVYDWNSKQPYLYDETVRPLVESVLEGFNGTVFAYGQTGTGKTFTMEGIRNDPEKRGVIPNSFEHIFNHIARSQNQQYLVRSSYLEIYQEEIRDLLAKDQTKRLELKERADIGVYVKDLSSFVCKSIKEIEHVMTIGNQNRVVGATNMNEHSSRSHAIFIITIEHSQVGIDNQTHIRVGKLNLVDLAGSERQNKTGAIGQRQKEAIKINLSLSALGNVISALVDGKSTHIPYRDSKLTRLLQDSLGGNAKTVMVANIGPASYNYEETLTTLRYANRAKNIKNKPRVNEDPKDALLREFQSEIERLKQLLEERRRKKEKLNVSDDSGRDSIIASPEAIDQEAVEKLAVKIKAMESKLLCGGKNIIDHTNEQERVLERKRQEITEHQSREREMLQKLEEQEDNTLEIRETFTSLQQEVELKKKKFRKLFAKLQSVKAEIKDAQEANCLERRELEELQNDLMKDLKLKYLVIDNFIPSEDKNRLLSRIVYDEDEEDWKLGKTASFEKLIITRRPSSLNTHRPMSEFSKIAAAVGSGIRYKGENLYEVELNMPLRTTCDYNAPVLSPRMRAALDCVLKTEEEIAIDASLNQTKTDPLKMIRAATATSKLMNRPKTAAKTTSNGTRDNYPQANRPDTASHYPQSRGLIQRR